MHSDGDSYMYFIWSRRTLDVSAFFGGSHGQPYLDPELDPFYVLGMFILFIVDFNFAPTQRPLYTLLA